MTLVLMTPSLVSAAPPDSRSSEEPCLDDNDEGKLGPERDPENGTLYVYVSAGPVGFRITPACIE